jgi:hypothetical protein
VRQSRAATLFLVFLTLLVICLWLLSRDPVVLARLRAALRPGRARPSPDYSAHLRQDPAVGTILSDRPTVPLSGASDKTDRGYVLLYVGECAGCLHPDIPRFDQDARSRGLRMVLLATAPQATAESFRRAVGAPRVPIVSDPKRALTRKLNAFTAPRVYLFSPRWELKWIQKEFQGAYFDPFADQGFVTALEEVPDES